MGNYEDPYGFEPLIPALHDLFMSMDIDGNGMHSTSDIENYSSYQELERLGYLEDVFADLTGTVYYSVALKGRRYSSDFSDWEKRRQDWEHDNEKRRERERAQDRKHDWKLNIVNGVYAIVSAVLGGVLGYFIGHLT